MTRMRPTKFEKVPRQTHSKGVASLRLPLRQLFHSYSLRFAKRALTSLWLGRSSADIDRYLVEYELHDSALNLEEWLGQLRPKPIDFNGEAADLKRLADFAEDLVDEDGRWTDDLAEAPNLARDAQAEIRDRVCRLRDAFAADNGPKQAHDVLKNLQRLFSERRDVISSDSQRWNAQDAAKLQACAARLRAMSRPRHWFWIALNRLRPGKVSPKHWLSSAQQALLRTQLLPAIRSAAQRRFADALRGHRLDLFERILGRPGQPGILEEAAAALTQYKTLLATVSHSLSGHAQAPVRSPNEILLVDDLDMTTDPAGNVRFIDLIEAEVRKSGCSPQGLADRLRHDGIVVAGRTYLPMEWRELPAARVQRQLMKAVAGYLGYQGRHAKLNLSRPQAAVEHVATITLDHPSLRHLLFHKVVELGRRSRPYALFQRIAGADPVVHAYLFCHPKHRLLLQQLLLARCNVTNRSHGEDEPQRGYQLRSPYVATLVQYTLAAPGGAQRDLQQAMRHANRVPKDGDIPPLFPDQSYPEIRLLEHRPDDTDDARQLLAAAKIAGVVLPVNGLTNAMQLAKHEPRLQGLFAEQHIIPEAKPATFFAQQLKSADFVNFVRVLFPQLPDWMQTVVNLRLEQDAETVATKLCSLGLVTAESGGLFRIAVVPQNPTIGYPESLYKCTVGSTTGLAEDVFVRQLTENDWLYNTVFWQTADAYDLGHLAPEHAPAFLKQYLEALGS